MSDNWIAIKDEINHFRDHVKNMTNDAKDKAKHSFLLTKEEIDKLLALKGHGQSLDGIRIYLGSSTVDGHLVPNVHVFAVEKDGHFYNDFGLPGQEAQATETMAKLAFTDQATAPAPMFASAALVPCPPTCNPKDPFGKG